MLVRSPENMLVNDTAHGIVQTVLSYSDVIRIEVL